jgi:gliding motility-associated protein GldC
MIKSDIKFEISLDKDRIPEEIIWSASDHKDNAQEATKAIGISVWDHNMANTLRIDLWTKEMPVNEMKQFYIDSVGGLAQSLLTATGDEFMASELKEVCIKLSKHLENELKGGKNL